MARPRKPIELLVAEGKKHLTKDEIRTRKEQQVKVSSDKVKCPRYLPP